MSTSRKLIDKPSFETGLMALHDVNFARYLVSANEFNKWKMGWGNRLP